ncbi:hypothetical protein PSPO01_00627 [Paraphaeosphaeria sporulosa]
MPPDIESLQDALQIIHEAPAELFLRCPSDQLILRANLRLAVVLYERNAIASKAAHNDDTKPPNLEDEAPTAIHTDIPDVEIQSFIKALKKSGLSHVDDMQKRTEHYFMPLLKRYSLVQDFLAHHKAFEVTTYHAFLRKQGLVGYDLQNLPADSLLHRLVQSDKRDLALLLALQTKSFRRIAGKQKLTLELLDRPDLLAIAGALRGFYESGLKDFGSGIFATASDDRRRKIPRKLDARDNDEEAQQRADEEARRADEEARRRADEEARRRADEEARRRADEEARRRADEEARRRAARQAEMDVLQRRMEELRRATEADQITQAAQAIDAEQATPDWKSHMRYAELGMTSSLSGWTPKDTIYMDQFVRGDYEHYRTAKPPICES